MGKQSRVANPQRRIAAALLKCGASRVWMEPTAAMKIGKAITRADVRRLIKQGTIKKLSEHVPSPSAGPRRQDIGSRKGARGARSGLKDGWLKIIRPQRSMLRELKPNFQPGAYRRLYRLVKGGAFRSRAHLKIYVDEKKLLRPDGKGGT